MEENLKKSAICYAIVSFIWIVIFTIAAATDGAMGIGQGIGFFIRIKKEVMARKTSAARCGRVLVNKKSLEEFIERLNKA